MFHKSLAAQTVSNQPLNCLCRFWRSDLYVDRLQKQPSAKNISGKLIQADQIWCMYCINKDETDDDLACIDSHLTIFIWYHFFP